MKRRIPAAMVLCLVLFSAPALYPCTTFCFQHEGSWVFGRNYDWDVQHCFVMVNKRNMAKQGFARSNPARWVSRFGSITFNQYGREFPLGGMNEAGLVIECMWLDATELPLPDQRGAVETLQWVQYQLDTAASIEDVVCNDKNIRISLEFAQPLHFLVCDARGNAAVIEFLAGKTLFHRNKELPVSALTNNTYSYSLKMLTAAQEKGETSAAFKQSKNSLKRFFHAAAGVRNWHPESSGPAVPYAFSVLEKASMKRTVLRVVYDVKNWQIHFFTRANPSPRHLNFKTFDFSCVTPVKFLDLAADYSGDVSAHFENYSLEINQALISKSIRESSELKNIPDQVIESMARFPEKFACCPDKTGKTAPPEQ